MLNNEEVMHALEKGTVTIEAALGQLTGERATDGKGLAMGTVIAIRRGDQPPEYAVAGYRDWDNTEPIQATDLFRIYSPTKTFTAILIRQLSEQKPPLLNLEDTVSSWVARIAPTIDAKERASLRKLHIHPKATIKDLLFHSSGIGNYSRGEFITAANSSPAKSWSPYDLFDYNNVDATEDIYDKFSYSDTGYNLLGLIAEHTTGKRYETMVEDICRAEGLMHTGFIGRAKSAASKAAVHLAHGYVENPATHTPTSSMEYDTSYAAGGLFSTARDMLGWAKRFHTRHGIPETPLPIPTDKTPSHCGEASYGYGVMIQQNGEGRKLYGHGGYARGGRSKVFYYPDTDTSIVTLETYETLTPTIAKELAKQHSAFMDENKTILLLRDSYTDETGKFNRSQLWKDWNHGKGKTVVMGRISEIVHEESLYALESAPRTVIGSQVKEMGSLNQQRGREA